MIATLENLEATPISTGEEDLRQFLSEIRRYPLLSPEEEKNLAKRCAAGDQDAIRQMVSSNLRLVVSVARKYAGRGVPLLAAARRFDYTQDVRFSTYATKGIHSGIVQCLIDHGQTIRVPGHTAEQIRRVEQARKELEQKFPAPTLAQIAEKCGMTEEKVKKYLLLQPETCSLDAPAGEEDGTLGVLLEDLQSPQPQEQLVRRELEETLEKLLSHLDDRQRQILRLHFGMADGTCYSLDQISKYLGISKERVRQIEKKAMKELQKLGENLGLEDFLVE